jgi:hypothetical protein
MPDTEDEHISAADVRRALRALSERSEIYEQVLASVIDSVRTIAREIAGGLRANPSLRNKMDAILSELKDMGAKLSQYDSGDDIIRRLRGD